MPLKVKHIKNYQDVHSYVSVDTETTGLYPMYGDRIIQLSAVKVIDDQVVDSFNMYVNPDGVTNAAYFVNDITDEELANAASTTEAQAKFLQFVEDLPWLGHNITFDLRFLANEGMDNFPAVIDTLAIARHTLGPKGNSLARLQTKFKIVNEKQHDALADAQATVKLFEILRELPERDYCHLGDSKHEVVEAEDNALAGLKIVVTGHFEIGNRNEMIRILKRHGATSPSNVSSRTDYVLLGVQTAVNVTDQKHNRSNKELGAIKFGTPVISYDDLVKMIEEER
ncbi:exonuclease domain-containing protein [Limosilactobacillus ingluviei]|uniref:exonuclease domain-containing protein n=1 Tax=Limosilactobacillus ingluviei TaxID=148604 RepID=UPI0023F446ED|nr:exonuclease domain-containing protein [Limosilactobacillus ingluviei]